MDRDWALDMLLRTERPGTIGHMIGGFLYDEPPLNLTLNEANEGIRSLCFLTRATKATAGYGEAPATRFLSVDRTRELYLRLPSGSALAWAAKFAIERRVGAKSTGSSLAWPSGGSALDATYLSTPLRPLPQQALPCFETEYGADNDSDINDERA